MSSINTTTRVDPFLSQISTAYFQRGNFFAGKLCPPVEVDGSGQVLTISKGDFKRADAGKRAPSTRPVQVNFSSSFATVTTEEWAAEVVLDAKKVRRASFDLERAGAMRAAEAVGQRLDAAAAAAFLGSGIWGAEETGVSSSPSTDQFLQWNDSSSTPLKDLLRGLDAVEKSTGRRPNRLALGPEVFSALAVHANFASSISLGPSGVTNQTTGDVESVAQRIADRVGLESVIRCPSSYNSAAQGQTASMSYHVGKVALLYYVGPAELRDALEPSACVLAFAPNYEGAVAVGDEMEPSILGTTYYFDDPLKSHVFSCTGDFKCHVQAADLAWFAASAVA